MNDFDDDELEDLVDQIQVGDRTEGAAAVRKLMAKAADPDAIANGVRTTIARDKVKSEFASALGDFGKKHPDLVKDDLYAEAGMHAVRDEIAKDFAALGIPDDKIAPIRGSSEHMLRAYSELRATGQRVRAPDEIFGVVGRELSKKFNLRTVSDRTPQNIVREMRAGRGFANEDNAPARPELTDAEKKRQERARRYLHDARKARGFETYE